MPSKTAPENIVESVQVPTVLPVQTKGKHPLHLVIKTSHVRKAATVDGELLPLWLLRCKHPVNLLQIILQDPAMKLMVKRQKQFSGTAQHIQPPVIVQVVEERSRPCQIDAGHKAGPASDISQNDLLQKLLRLKGNPAEIPVKLHLCMGIPIFVQLYDRKLLIGNRESHSLPDNGQQGLGRFFIGISVDPQKVRHLRKCPIDRVGIARALIMNPKLIIADECISALDVSIQAQVVNLMKDIQQETGTAYLFIAHDLSMVKYISDRIGVLHLGHLLETGTTEEIFANPIHPYTRSLLSAIPLPNPVVEKRRVAETYDYATSGIDYSKGTSHLVSGSHYVKCTDEEFAKWCK